MIDDWRNELKHSGVAADAAVGLAAPCPALQSCSKVVIGLGKGSMTTLQLTLF